MSNPRLDRLALDHEQLTARFRTSPAIRITAQSGEPPEHYQITYFVRGYFSTPGGEVVEGGEHVVTLDLPADYPESAPVCRSEVTIFHPNFDEARVDVAAGWTPSSSLDDLIIRIGRMIAFQEYDLHAPLNPAAAEWAGQNAAHLPLDPTELAPPPVVLAAAPAPMAEAPPVTEAEPISLGSRASALTGRTMTIGAKLNRAAPDLKTPVIPRPLRAAFPALAMAPLPGAAASFTSAEGYRLDFGLIAIALPPDGKVTLGRRPGNDIQCSDLGVSGFHAEIIRQGSEIRVRDLGSTNGTIINDAKVSEALLSPGDRLVFGEIKAQLVSDF